MDVDKNIIRTIDAYLDAKDVDLGCHQGIDKDAYYGGYCYYSSPQERINTLTYAVTIEEAIRKGWIEITSHGILMPGGEVIPIQFDMVKIRRRAEDALRKTNDENILRVALLLGVKLT